MTLLFDAFWRAVAYCLHPRVILLSLLPLFVVGGATGVLGYFYWEDAVAGVRTGMEHWKLLAAMLQWLDAIGAGSFRTVLAPLVVVALVVPVVVVLSLLLVAVLMTPAIVSIVAARRFPGLERRRGAGFWSSAATSLGCTLVAMIALVVSIPLWFVPPLVLVVPPLIWGWLTYRVMAFDVLAEHASADERRAMLVEHHWPMLGMGVVAGYLGAAPSLVWALGALTLVFAPLLIVVAIWLYTLVFAFSALWFAHYALAALQRRRLLDGGNAPPPPLIPPSASPAPPRAFLPPASSPSP